MNRTGPAPLALTMGEPGGVGGELSLLAWLHCRSGGPVFFAIDDPARLRGIAAALGWDVPVQEIDSPAAAAAAFTTALPVLPLGQPVATAPGHATAGTAAAVIKSIEIATRLSQDGAAGGIVTNPVQKSVLIDAGFDFPGHTEYVARLCGRDFPVMMLAVTGLRVVPVTVHNALARVPDLLSADLLCRTARTVAEALRRDFGIAAPRLAFAGLNPHAGEDGHMGREELDVIAPALAQLRREGYSVDGPRPADTMFHAEARATYDVALCMYHDQALIPLKTLDFYGGVNVTLGLPIVRTSPDHGTALDIAGSGRARPDSLIAALDMAAAMAAERSKHGVSGT
jgi:4-hydroxythreonine-4-phosphate dehydrogenase